MKEKEIREMLKRGLVSIRYVKKDGETRNAVGTTNLLFVPKAQHPKASLQPPPEWDAPGTTTNEARFRRSAWVKDGYVRYYDFTVQDWRCLVCSEILEAKPIESLSLDPIPDVPSPTRSLSPVGRGEKMENASLISNEP